jgi:hypothetical protein
MDDEEAEPVAISRIEGNRVCVTPPRRASSSGTPEYFVVDIGIPGLRMGPARVHFYSLGNGQHRVVALERPDTIDPPG